MTAVNALITRYVRQLETELTAAGVPQDERTDILSDITSHAAEAEHSGQPIASILEKIGPAPELARSYAAELFLLPPTKPDASPTQNLFATITRAGVVCASLLLVVIMGAVGLGLTLSGLAAIIGGIILPFLPNSFLDPTLRRGLPQVVTVVVGIVLLVVGMVSLRLVRINFTMVINALRQNNKEKEA